MQIGNSDRAVFLGTTGSGKSFLAGTLLRRQPRLVVVDPSGDPGLLTRLALRPWEQIGAAVRAGKPGRAYIGPAPRGDKGAREAYWERAFYLLGELTHCYIHIDELYGVGPNAGSDGIRFLYTQGRKRKLSVYGCTQRPVFLPKFALTEAEWVFAFRLTDPDDRRLAGKLLGLETPLPRLPKREFIYAGPPMDHPVRAVWRDGQLDTLGELNYTTDR